MELLRQFVLVLKSLFCIATFNTYSAQVLQPQQNVTVFLFNENVTLFKPILSRLENKLRTQYKSTFNLRQYQLYNFTHAMTSLCSSLETNQLPIVGSLRSPLHHTVAAFIRNFDLPYITWDTNVLSLTSRRNNYLQNGEDSCKIFSLQPDLTEPLIDFIVTWKWRTFSYVYTSEESFNRMQQVFHELYIQHRYQIDVDTVNLPLNETITNNLFAIKQMDKRLSRSKKRNIIVDIFDKAHVLNILNKVKLLGMVRWEYHYLFINFDICQLDFNSYRTSRVTISGFQIIDYQKQSIYKNITDCASLMAINNQVTDYQSALVLDSIEVLHRVLRHLQNSGLLKSCQYNASSCWKMKTSTKPQCIRGNEISSFIKSLDFSGYTGHILFDPETCRRQNFSVMLSVINEKTSLVNAVQWSSSSRWTLSKASSNMFPFLSEEKSVHLPNGTIRVVSIISEPFMYYKHGVVGKPMSGKHNFIGYCKDLIELIFNELDIEYELYLVKDGQYGAYDKNKKRWNGIIGELIRGEADIAVAPLTVTSSREKVVNFTEPYMTFGLSIIIKKPHETEHATFSFLYPLTYEVWGFIIVAWLIVSLGLYIIARCSPYEWKTKDSQIIFNLSNCLWFNFASFMGQGVDYAPKSPAARFLISCWWSFSIIIMAYYTANLIACLSIENIVAPIENLEDLATNTHIHGIKTGLLDNGSTKNFFATSSFFPYNLLYSNMVNEPDVFAPTIKEAMHRVRHSRGKYAFILESKMNEFINQRLPCDTMKVGEIFSKKIYAIALPSSPQLGDLREVITHSILSLGENQILDKLYHIWWIEKGQCDTEEKRHSEPLSLVNVCGTFYILFLGIIMAVAIEIVNALKISYRHRNHHHFWRQRIHWV